jgi:Mce-associated membrane protein
MTRSTTEEAAVAPTPKKTTATTKSAAGKAAAVKRSTNGASTTRRAPRPSPVAEPEVVDEDAVTEDSFAEDEDLYADDAYDYPAAVASVDRGSAWRILAALATLVAILLVTALIFLVVKVNAQDAANSRRTAVLAAAEKYGVYLSSYSYKNLTGNGSDWSLVTENATPSFNKDFSATSTQLGQLLKQYNASATGKVVAAGISSVSSSRAVVLIFIDQTVTNSANKSTPVSQPLRVQLTMSHQHGKWLIDSLELPR